MWQEGAATERLISSLLKIRDGLVLLSEPVIKQNWCKKKLKPCGERHIIGIGFAKGNAAVSNLFWSMCVPASLQYPVIVEHSVKVLLSKTTISGVAPYEKQLLPVSCQDRHFILYYFSLPKMGFCNLWKQYPLTTPLTSVTSEQGGSTGTPEVPLFLDNLMWPSFMGCCPAWPDSPWKEQKKEKNSRYSRVLSSESHTTLGFPEAESRAGLTSILPLAAEPAAGWREGRKVFSREFPKKRCLGTKVVNATAALTGVVILLCCAGNDRGCGDAVLTTVEEKMQPILPPTPLQWDWPSTWQTWASRLFALKRQVCCSPKRGHVMAW